MKYFIRALVLFSIVFAASFSACSDDAGQGDNAGQGDEASEVSLSPEMQQLLKAAEQGDVKAQLSLGQSYASVGSANPNYVEAAKWYRKAAEQGDAEAQYYLASCYNLGEGVE